RRIAMAVWLVLSPGSVATLLLRLANPLNDAGYPSRVAFEHRWRATRYGLRFSRGGARQLNDILADMAQAAAHLRMGRWAFIGQALGQGFASWQRELRLRRACFLLLYSDQAITGIAMDCGFACLSTFNRQFRQLMRCTPSAYRTAYIA
ncbi:MAG: helix-turn-helix transcriptional regulator, partial [Planctomycetota bacterium]